jgi:hypothetical protein
MAVENTLGEQTLSYFGIDDARLTQLSTEYELDRLKREAYERQLAEEKQSEANSNLQMQNSVQEAVQKFNNQINEIITEEGLDLPTLAEKDQLKADILKYARDNGIYDMHKAYNALAYERQKEAKAKQAKVEQSHAKKSATQKVSKGGAGAGQTTSSNDGKSLDDIIWENMGKLGMK